MERVVERSNIRLAYQRVIENKGAAGIDEMPVSELKDWLAVHWPSVKKALLEGAYLPQPVRRVDIPKANGGVRTLGVPTVVDRLIQQALHQVLQPLFEPTFSEGSYGFRPGRGAHQAVRQAQAHIRDGKRWVVDIDLERFFDRVNHAVLMARVARRVDDARVLKLIRRFLEAGMMRGGVVEARTEGTPQGGPLSPLLSNILLDDLDRELERRELAFCRYADDCNIYVSSRVAGERVMRGIRVFLEDTLRLRINAQKSAVARPWGRKFLGFSVTARVGRTRWLGAPSPTLSAVAPVEARSHPRTHDACAGHRCWACSGEQRPWSWSLVERWSVPPESGPTGCLLHTYGAGLAAQRVAATPECSLNRRMRNRTSGGVGGR